MATENIRLEEKHKPVQDAQDIAYLNTIDWLIIVERDIKNRIGTFVIDFPMLELCFTELFEHTKNERAVRDQHKELIVKIEHWLYSYNGRHINKFIGKNKKIVIERIKIIRRWNAVIRRADVIKQ